MSVWPYLQLPKLKTQRQSRGPTRVFIPPGVGTLQSIAPARLSTKRKKKIAGFAKVERLSGSGLNRLKHPHVRCTVRGVVRGWIMDSKS